MSRLSMASAWQLSFSYKVVYAYFFRYLYVTGNVYLCVFAYIISKVYLLPARAPAPRSKGRFCARIKRLIYYCYYYLPLDCCRRNCFSAKVRNFYLHSQYSLFRFHRLETSVALEGPLPSCFSKSSIKAHCSVLFF